MRTDKVTRSSFEFVDPENNSLGRSLRCKRPRGTCKKLTVTDNPRLISPRELTAQFVRSVSNRYLQGSRMCLGIAGVFLMGHTVLATQTPSYVQSNYAVSQTPQTTVTVPYTATQRATDLNVVVVGWNDTT